MRLPFALLLSIAALVASSHLVPAGSRHATLETPGTQTQAPNQGHDDAWQPLTRAATTTESASQFRSLHTRAVAAISQRAPFPQVERRIRARVDAARDRSPHHPIPLLI